MEEKLGWGVVIFWITGGIALLVVAVRTVEREEAAGSGEGWFRPVGIAKFFLLTTVTSGLYSLYWFWRCWRRYHITEEADISPFWRAAFVIFYIVSLFRSADEKAKTRWPIWIAAISTVMVLATNIAINLAIRYDTPLWQTEIAGALSTLAFVPLVMQVNRINTPELVGQRARFSTLDWCALAWGAPIWLTTLIIL